MWIVLLAHSAKINYLYSAKITSIYIYVNVQTPVKDSAESQSLLRTETGEVFEPMHILLSTSVPPSAQNSPSRSLGDYRVAAGGGAGGGGYVTSLHGGSMAGTAGISGGAPASFPGGLAGVGAGHSSGSVAGATTQIATSKFPNHPNNQRDGTRVVSSDIRADGHRRKGGKSVMG